MSWKHRPKTQKDVWILLFLGAGLLVAGFLTIAIGGWIEKRGGTPNYFVIIGSFVIFEVLGIILLFIALHYGTILDAEEKQEKYSKQPLTHLPNLTRERIDEAFQAAGFRKKDGFWYKRQFSRVWGGRIFHYYACCSTTEEDMKRVAGLDDLKLASKNMCLFLFLCQEQVTPEDERDLREYAIAFILDEVLPERGHIHTSVPVLLDEAEGEGWFLEASKGIPFYAHGCKFLRKLFL